MLVKSAAASILTFGYNGIRYCIDAIIHVIIVATNVSLMMLNAALSILVLLEETAVVLLILPWIPTKKIGNLFRLLRKFGFPHHLTFIFYIFMGLVVVCLNIISLELHYLQVNEGLTASFDEFQSSLLTSMKLFVVLHRFLHILANEASLRNTCYFLKKRLKIEQDEELSEQDLDLPPDADLEISDLKAELERTKLDLEAMREAYNNLQRKMMMITEGDASYSSSFQ